MILVFYINMIEFVYKEIRQGNRKVREMTVISFFVRQQNDARDDV
jgi:hypothetical protein